VETVRKNSPDSLNALLLQILDEAFEKKAWHGPNLKGSLRGVNAGQAAWRPARGRHNIWEIAVHAAYWKYAVRRRLRGETRGSFPLRGSNWFASPASVNEKGWRQVRAILLSEHRGLREAVAEMDHATQDGKRLSMVFGVAFHDVYHAGQVQLLKRLQRGTKRA
jgi:hypothetical protein